MLTITSLNKFFGLSLLAVILSGCGQTTSSASNSSNPCPSVDAPILATENYTVTDNLSQSYSYDLLPAIQLSSNDTSLDASTKSQIKDALTNINGIINQFVNYTPLTKGGDFTQTSKDKSVENELDLMESLIAHNSLSNINLGRSTMRTVINNSQICKYDNTQIAIANAVDPTSKRYYIVRYTYSPNTPQTDGSTVRLLTKTIASSVLKPKAGTSNTNTTISATTAAQNTTQQFTAISVVKLNPDTFSASGYNKPLFVRAIYGGSTVSLNLTDDFEKKTGSIEYINSTPFSLNSAHTNIKRVRFDVDYAMSRVKVYVSTFLKQYKKPDGTLVTDPTTTEYQALIDSTGGRNRDGTYNFTQVYDANYSTLNNNTPTPIYSYTGNSIASRQ
jgi:hypothetical protein